MRQLTLSAAATFLGIDRKTLNKRLTMLGITPTSSEHDGRVLMLSEADVHRLAGLGVEQNQLEALRAQVEVLTVRVQALELREPVQRPVVSLPPLDVAYRASREVYQQPGRGLPPGYASLSVFCKEHGIPVTTVKAAIDRGELFCHHGSWHAGRAIVQHALDEQEQAAVLERYG